MAAKNVSVCVCGDHAFVPLTKGLVTLFSAEDASLVAAQSWQAFKSPVGILYAKGKPIVRDGETYRFLHRYLTGAVAGEAVDHANHDGLDNRRPNLRVCEQSQNLANARRRKDGGLYRGVSFRKDTRKYVAQISFRKKHINLGCFATPEEAARAYDEAAIKFYGEFAKPNFPHSFQHAVG